MGKTKKLQKKETKKDSLCEQPWKRKKKGKAKKEKRVVQRRKETEKTQRGYWA